MERLQQTYPRQRRRSYIERVLQHSVLVGLGRRLPYAAFVNVCRAAGGSHASILDRAVRSFDGDDFFERIRHRPNEALLRVLRRRLRGYDLDSLERRARAGRYLSASLGGRVEVPGGGAKRHTFWLFPALSPEPDALVDVLQARSFDATRGGTSLTWLRSPDPRRFPHPARARRIDEQAVYLPAYRAVGRAKLEEMAHLVVEHARKGR